MAIPPRHRHLIEVDNRQIACSCDACALRFHDVVDGRFKLIPRDAVRLPEFEIDDATWDDLALPINLAFFFHSSPEQRLMAMYPSPAGATESRLSLDAWDRLREANPDLGSMEDDVQALLVNRIGAERTYYIAPIDKCFQLVGLIRLHWRGLSGGEKVWTEVAGFFDTLDRQTRSAGDVRNA